jgi:hypothetical protein
MLGKVSLGMPFAARRKIVHSNFGLNFVLTFQRKPFMFGTSVWTLPIAFAVFYLMEKMYTTRFFVFVEANRAFGLLIFISLGHSFSV